jgi:tetratricopeptide (TPR) repeat protein
MMTLVATALAQEALSTAAKDGTKEDGVQEEISVDAGAQDGDKSPELIRETVFQAIDQMIDISKHMGDAETAAQLQAYRDHFPGDDERQYITVVAVNSCNMAQSLRERGELISAGQLIQRVLQLAEALKGDQPSLFFAAHYAAAQLNLDFERFDEALKHTTIALKHNEHVDISRRNSIACRATYAFALRKLQRFDEAERVYLTLFETATNDPAELLSDDLPNL